jgi:hypothetical protein
MRSMHGVVSNVHIHKMTFASHERERRERNEGGGEKRKKKRERRFTTINCHGTRQLASV